MLNRKKGKKNFHLEWEILISLSKIKRTTNIARGKKNLTFSMTGYQHEDTRMKPTQSNELCTEGY